MSTERDGEHGVQGEQGGEHGERWRGRCARDGDHGERDGEHSYTVLRLLLRLQLPVRALTKGPFGKRLMQILFEYTC